jgi:tetratricopeptide (TPR) repeat protein
VLVRLTYLLLFVGLLLAPHFSAYAQREKRKKTESATDAAIASESESFFTEGEKFFILEDYAKALLYFLRANELNPANSAIAYKIAEVLIKSGKDEDFKKAEVYIEQALRLEKKNKYYYLLASNIYNSLGQFGKSTQVLEALTKEIPETEEYLYELASIYQFDKKDEEAIRAYNRAEAALGINEVSSLQKQRIFLESGRVNEAIREGEKLIEAFPDEERYVMAFAELLGTNKQLPRAIAYLENHLLQHPQSSSAKMLLGGLYRDGGQEKKSKEVLLNLFSDPQAALSSKLIVLGTYNATIVQNKAKGINEAELESFVIELFNKVESTDPNNANVNMVGGDLFLTLDRKQESRDRYSKAIQLGAQGFEVWQNLLFLETQAQLYDSVILHAEQAVESFPNHGMVYYFNGYAHLRKKEFAPAVQQLEQAKKLFASDQAQVAEINGMLGDAYQALKQYDKSASAYDEALAFNPMNDIILNNFSYYLSLRKADLEKAEKMSSLLIKHHPDNIAYLDTHAWVLYNREKYKEAKKVMERALTLEKPTAVNFEHYGDILYKLGNVDEAVVQWRKAKAMDSRNQEVERKIANRKIS